MSTKHTPAPAHHKDAAKLIRELQCLADAYQGLHNAVIPDDPERLERVPLGIIRAAAAGQEAHEKAVRLLKKARAAR